MNNTKQPKFQPKISVITVSYNQAEFIRDCIESVLAQNYPNFEHIVIDGGSTDGTLEILKEYPHLNWVSEPDRGQSHALNKGFAKAQGEIIAWLNCDDWYASGAFEVIAKELEDYPVLLTSAHEVNRDKSLRQVVPNYCKTKYDLLKNWIPYAWVAQVAVFFRRDLLESVKLADGQYLDESLYFCMDLDLWMRMANLYPFIKRVDQVCAYYRIYESNKTGARPLATNRECMRTFRRYESIWNKTEQKISFVIAVNQITEKLAETVSSIVEQDLPEYDIAIADYSGDKAVGKALRNYVFDLLEAINHTSFRYLPCTTTLQLEAYNQAVSASPNNIVVLSQPGDTFNKEFCRQISDVFSRDLAGALIPNLSEQNIPSSIFNSHSNTVDPIALLQAKYFSPNLVVRKLAFMDVGGFQYCNLPALAEKLFLLKVVNKGWWLCAENELNVKPALQSYLVEQESLDALGSQINAQIILDLDLLSRESEYSSFKTRSGYVAIFPPNAVNSAKELLAKSPSNWYEIPNIKDAQELSKISLAYPECAGAWFYLAKQLNLAGDTSAEESALQKFRKLQMQNYGAS